MNIELVIQRIILLVVDCFDVFIVLTFAIFFLFVIDNLRIKINYITYNNELVRTTIILLSIRTYWFPFLFINLSAFLLYKKKNNNNNK